MLASLSTAVGATLTPRAIQLPSGVRAEIDGATADDTLLAKLVPTQSTARSAVRNRVLADMLKLVWLRSCAAPRARLALCITAPVAPYFSPTSWPAQAAIDLGIDIYVHREDATSRLIPPP